MFLRKGPASWVISAQFRMHNLLSTLQQRQPFSTWASFGCLFRELFLFKKREGWAPHASKLKIYINRHICSTLSESIRELILLRKCCVISLSDTPLEESRKHYNSIVVRYIYWGFLISCHCGKASSPAMIFKEYSLLSYNKLPYIVGIQVVSVDTWISAPLSIDILL